LSGTVKLSVSKINEFFSLCKLKRDGKIYKEDITKFWGKNAKAFEFFISASLLYVMEKYRKLWFPARIVDHWDDWLQLVSNRPSLFAMVFLSEDEEIIPFDEIQRRRPEYILVNQRDIVSSTRPVEIDTIKKLLAGPDVISYFKAEKLGLGYERLNKLLRLALVEAFCKTRTEYEPVSSIYPPLIKKAMKGLCTPIVNLKPMKLVIDRYEASLPDVEISKDDLINRGLMKTVLEKETQYRRFIIGLMILERTRNPEALMVFNPVLKSNNLLSRWCFLTHPAVDYAVRFFSDGGLIEIYETYKRQGRRIFFSGLVDFFADLLVASRSMENLEKKQRIYNLSKVMRLKRHLEVLNISNAIGEAREIFNLICKNTLKNGGIIFSINGPYEELVSSESVNPWNLVAINWASPSSEEFCHALKEFIPNDFLYLPLIRYKTCYKLGISFNDFNRKLKEVIEGPPPKWSFELRLRGDYGDHYSHFPLVINGMKYDRLKINLEH